MDEKGTIWSRILRIMVILGAIVVTDVIAFTAGRAVEFWRSALDEISYEERLISELLKSDARFASLEMSSDSTGYVILIGTVQDRATFTKAKLELTRLFGQRFLEYRLMGVEIAVK